MPRRRGREATVTGRHRRSSRWLRSASVRADGHHSLDNAAGQWSTVRTQRRLLVVVHNVTPATRLLDVLPLVTDRRIQIFFTSTGSSASDAATTELLARLEAAVIPWDEAVHGHFDLTLTASYGGDLH